MAYCFFYFYNSWYVYFYVSAVPRYTYSIVSKFVEHCDIAILMNYASPRASFYIWFVRPLNPALASSPALSSHSCCCRQYVLLRPVFKKSMTKVEGTVPSKSKIKPRSAPTKFLPALSTGFSNSSSRRSRNRSKFSWQV